jgi:hypothetical protein
LFVSVPEGIAGIAFDAATATLSLPILTLDGNTEVVLHNRWPTRPWPCVRRLEVEKEADVRGPHFSEWGREKHRGILGHTRIHWPLATYAWAQRR